MNDDSGEKVAAKEARQRTRIFCFLVKIEYDGKAAKDAVAYGSATEVCSMCSDGVGGFVRGDSIDGKAG
jgi:hypothetical protein